MGQGRISFAPCGRRLNVKKRIPDGEVTMRTATLLAATTAVLLSLHAAQAQEKLKIGFIATLSGPPAVLGTQLKNGFLMGIKDLGGKLGGREVEVIVQDDELKP